MAPRKPPGVPFETFIEAQIRRAQEAGDFENLPGEGKPLERVGKRYDPDWWAKQLVQRENLSILPPSLEIRLEVEKGLASLAELRNEREVRDRIGELNAKILKVNSQVTLGPLRPNRFSTRQPRSSAGAGHQASLSGSLQECGAVRIPGRTGAEKE